MKGILADVNIQKYVHILVAISRLRNSREYLHQVVESLLDALLRVESLRGTGRLFLP